MLIARKNKLRLQIIKPVVLLLIASVLLSCTAQEMYIWKPLNVSVTAYNSVSSQTDGQPNIAAWGDTLVPGAKTIAVSRDLIPLGLKYNTSVKIEGLEGIYLVKDKMHHRWTKRIDIYMGTDVQKAKNWGRKKLTIQYGVLKDSVEH